MVPIPVDTAQFAFDLWLIVGVLMVFSAVVMWIVVRSK